MKKVFLQATLLIVIVLSISWISGCNSGSEKKTEDKSTFNQEAFNQKIQGVFEYLSPNQGLAANFDNNFIFVFGDSDTTMICQGGTYETSGDTVIYTTQFASSPELVGSIIKWSPEFMENGSIKVFLFDDTGNIISEHYDNQKVKLDENTIGQLKKFEGSYKYIGSKGGGILLSGYGVYLSQSSGGAGTYVHRNDTVTFTRLFSTIPDLIGTKVTWVNESISGDTLNWATIDDEGEVISRGKSLY